MKQEALFQQGLMAWVAVEPLVELVWPGPPATKKTSNVVFFPKLREYRSSAREFVTTMVALAEEARRQAQRDGKTERLDALILELRGAVNRFRPIVTPSKQFAKFERRAVKATKEQRGEAPFVIHDPVIVEAHWYHSTLNLGDFAGLVQATSDVLERAEVIRNDSLIQRFHEHSHRAKDKDNPRTEIIVWSAEQREV